MRKVTEEPEAKKTHRVLIIDDDQGMSYILTRALEYRVQKLALRKPLEIDRQGIIGTNPRRLMCIGLMGHAAKSDANVLIYGETGTGKELVAKAIHLNSPRRLKPFVVVDWYLPAPESRGKPSLRT